LSPTEEDSDAKAVIAEFEQEVMGLLAKGPSKTKIVRLIGRSPHAVDKSGDPTDQTCASTAEGVEPVVDRVGILLGQEAGGSCSE